ncbi:MAG: hypothetical protein WCI29_07165 [Actinomycetes bacterium]
MRATAKDFDPSTRSGSVLTDAGYVLPYDAAAFDAGGLRLLRSGQRVRVRLHTDGPVQLITAVTLATFALPDEDSE